MIKQTLCTTLPISVAIIVAGAFIADAGDLDPPAGAISPTMNTLEEVHTLISAEGTRTRDEIYDRLDSIATQVGSPVWEYVTLDVAYGSDITAITGTGILHGLWLKRSTQVSDYNAGVRVCNGPCSADWIGDFGQAAVGTNYIAVNKFFQLDVAFDSGVNLLALWGDARVTLLYRRLP